MVAAGLLSGYLSDLLPLLVPASAPRLVVCLYIFLFRYTVYTFLVWLHFSSLFILF